MLVLFSINHPSQYHMFKHLARKIIDSGGSVFFFIQDRGMIERLVQADGYEYSFSTSPGLRTMLQGKYSIVLRSFISVTQQELRIFWYNIFHKVDFMLGCDIAIAHVGFLMRRKAWVFTDDDYVFTRQYCHIAYPFAQHIVAPFVADTHKWTYKKIGYLGTQKSAYLHPDYFVPDEAVLDKYNLRDTRFFIIRLVSFVALHDSLHGASTGISESVLGRIIPLLKAKGKIIISLEGGDRDKYQEFVMKIDPTDMHSLLYYADMLIGDSQSMQVEAALLGTPAIRSNKWVLSKHKVNVIHYLETKYGMCYSISPLDEDGIVNRVEQLLDAGIKAQWKILREKFFAENTNLTDFLFWITSKYPVNYKKYMTKKDIIKEFVYNEKNSDGSGSQTPVY